MTDPLDDLKINSKLERKFLYRPMSPVTMNTKPTEPKQLLDSWFLHPITIAFYTGVVIFILLVVVQPAFVMTSIEVQHPNAQARHMLRQVKKLSWIKVAIWTAIPVAIIIALPYLVDWIGTLMKK